MKNEPLQPSELLANHFAPYRAEAPLISAPEIEKLLAGSATADHPPTPSFFRRWNVTNIRRIIMTLSGLAGLAAISYFAFFNTSQGSNGSNRTHTTYASHETQPQTALATSANKEKTTPQPNTTKQLRKTDNPHGPWSAGNDQFYADLSREELAKLGIVVEGDTVIAYKLPSTGTLESMPLTSHSIGGGKAILPPDVKPPSFYPVLMTHNNGHGAAFIIEEKGQTKEWGMTGDDSMVNVVRDWLKAPGNPGYIPVWYTTNSFRPCDTCGEVEKWKLEVGKNFAKPIFPFIVQDNRGFSDSTKAALMQLANYYCGKAEKPNFTLPKNLFISADTVTPQNLLDEIDSGENDATMKHLHATIARLNELVPIIVRKNAGAGAPGNDDFIFWYEPSDELFDALPPAQAAIFRTKIAEPPHCLSAPNAVLTTVDITYCVSEPQKVHLIIQDLTGKKSISFDQDAVAGDNVWKVGTETLPSGMYLVTVREANGSERTRRMWIENAHPKEPGWDMPTPTEVSVSYDDDSSSDNGQKAILNVPCLKLEGGALANIGIRSTDSSGGFYFQSSPGHVDFVQLFRVWNSKTRIYEQNRVQIGGTRHEFLGDADVTQATPQMFQPVFVTTAKGQKRLFTNDPIIPTKTDDPATVIQKFKEIDQRFLKVDSLIPILLRADNTSDSVGARDLIFWYKPTPEFLASLPDSASAVAQMMASGTTNAAASVTDIHSAIQSASVYPNPSHGKFNVSVTANAKRTITITLRNLLGQQVAPPVQTFQMGMSATPNSVTYTYSPSPSLDYSNAPEGVYLLDISSDQGERYIERVVIAH